MSHPGREGPARGLIAPMAERPTVSSGPKSRGDTMHPIQSQDASALDRAPTSDPTATVGQARRTLSLDDLLDALMEMGIMALRERCAHGREALSLIDFRRERKLRRWTLEEAAAALAELDAFPVD